MRYFITILAIFLAVSCSTVKKITETSKTRSMQVTHQDSSATIIETGSILNSLITKIDSSRITIIDYSAPDSSGHQAVIRETIIENNIKTTQKAVKKNSTKGVAVKIVKDSTTFKSIEKTKISEQRKPQTLNKLLIQIAAYLILALIALFGSKWLKNKIKGMF